VVRAIAAVAVVLALGATAIAQAPAVRLDGQVFRVVNWTPPALPPPGGWASVLTIYAGRGNVPALLGGYSFDKGQLIFRPAYPIAAGVQYRVVFHPPGGAAIETTLAGPAKDVTPSAHVEQVFPSADEWPSNTLRLYVQFSAAMSAGEASTRLRILDANGTPLDDIFLPGEELWDPAHRRLTLTFDPGRIKRGLASNAGMGPPIAAGARYTLVVDREWLDARGAPMTAGFRKDFRGGPAVRVPPDPKTWRVAAPTAGSTQAVTLTFPRPMNVALLPRMIQVATDRGSVAGTVAIDRHETVWRFTPQRAWTPGAYRLVVDLGLEDVAGNRPGLPFDVDAVEPPPEGASKGTFSIPFRID
jgi:hypothetical protein